MNWSNAIREQPTQSRMPGHDGPSQSEHATPVQPATGAQQQPEKPVDTRQQQLQASFVSQLFLSAISNPTPLSDPLPLDK